MHADERPDAPALTCGPVTLTWRDLHRRTNRLARAYEAQGVGQDDLVTIALPNSTAFIEAALAVWKLGATPQPVSARLPGRELHEIVELANSRLVVGVPSQLARAAMTHPDAEDESPGMSLTEGPGGVHHRHGIPHPDVGDPDGDDDALRGAEQDRGEREDVLAGR